MVTLPLPYSVGSLGAQSCYFIWKKRESSVQWSRLLNMLSLSSLKEALLLWPHMFKAIPEFVVSSQNSPWTYMALTMTKRINSPWPLPQTAAS